MRRRRRRSRRDRWPARAAVPAARRQRGVVDVRDQPRSPRAWSARLPGVRALAAELDLAARDARDLLRDRDRDPRGVAGSARARTRARAPRDRGAAAPAARRSRRCGCPLRPRARHAAPTRPARAPSDQQAGRSRRPTGCRSCRRRLPTGTGASGRPRSGPGRPRRGSATRRRRSSATSTLASLHRHGRSRGGGPVDPHRHRLRVGRVVGRVHRPHHQRLRSLAKLGRVDIDATRVVGARDGAGVVAWPVVSEHPDLGAA